MPRSMTASLIVTVTFICSACQSKSDSSHSTLREDAAAEMMDDKDEVPPPRSSVSAVMQAKLAHAQAVLEAIALADFVQAESNALALKRISHGGEWLVQDTAAYFAFSSEFRDICDDLVNDAHSQNIQALVRDYSNLTSSCVACHDYLRMERQTQDMPGRISMFTHDTSVRDSKIGS